MQKIHIEVQGQRNCDSTRSPPLPSPPPPHHPEDGWSFKKREQYLPPPAPRPPPQKKKICPCTLYITEQSMLMMLLLPKDNYLIWTSWLPWWTAGLLGKCVRNCRTLCPESRHFHSSSWTWEMEWPRSGKRVSISHKKQKAQLKLNLISVAYLIWLPSESIWRAYSMTLCIPFSFKSLWSISVSLQVSVKVYSSRSLIELKQWPDIYSL